MVHVLTIEDRRKGGAVAAERGVSGRPPDRIKALARRHDALVIRVLKQIVASGEDERARVAAAQVLLDRGYGKPQQYIEVSTSEQRERILALEAALVGEIIDAELVESKQAAMAPSLATSAEGNVGDGGGGDG